MSRAEKRRQWVVTLVVLSPSFSLLMNSNAMLLIFGARLPPNWLRLFGPLTGQAVHDALRVVFCTYLLATVGVTIWAWRTAARDARRTLTGASGIGR